MSTEIERVAGETTVLPVSPSPLTEQADTLAILEDLRHESERTTEAPAEMAGDVRPFSWDIDPEEMATAISTAATLPWIIWLTGMSLAYSLWLAPINLFREPTVEQS